MGIIKFAVQMSKQQVIFRDLGTMAYQEAWDLQETMLRENVDRKKVISHRLSGSMIEGSDMLDTTEDSRKEMASAVLELDTEHHLLFVEHPPVYTLGKSGKPEHILISESEREHRNIAYTQTNRGGDITFHGPEQIVGYPILDLEKFYTDIGKYLRNLEEVIILTMAEYGLKGERSAGETGVWLDPLIKGKERKICAMGVRCSRWITMHGFAFNVNTDLTYFDHIVPCGIPNKQVTSLQKELGRTLAMNEVKEKLKRNFEKVFDASLVAII